MDVPRAYVLSRNASPALVRSAIAAFCITPIYFVLVCNPADYPLAFQFGAEVLKTATEADALDVALVGFEQQNMPSLVIGDWQGAGAIYDNGRLEMLSWPDQDLMPN